MALKTNYSAPPSLKLVILLCASQN